jgi:hypothetical protein
MVIGARGLLVVSATGMGQRVTALQRMHMRAPPGWHTWSWSAYVVVAGATCWECAGIGGSGRTDPWWWWGTSRPCARSPWWRRRRRRWMLIARLLRPSTTGRPDPRAPPQQRHDNGLRDRSCHDGRAREAGTVSQRPRPPPSRATTRRRTGPSSSTGIIDRP